MHEIHIQGIALVIFEKAGDQGYFILTKISIMVDKPRVYHDRNPAEIVRKNVLIGEA